MTDFALIMEVWKHVCFSIFAIFFEALTEWISKFQIYNLKAMDSRDQEKKFIKIEFKENNRNIREIGTFGKSRVRLWGRKYP